MHMCYNFVLYLLYRHSMYKTVVVPYADLIWQSEYKMILFDMSKFCTTISRVCKQYWQMITQFFIFHL